MKTNKGNVVCNEVLAMLEQMPSYDYYKLPSDVIMRLRENSVKDYKFVIENNEFSDISRQAYLIFVKIYRDYISNKEDIEKLNELLNLNDKRRQEEYKSILKKDIPNTNTSVEENKTRSTSIDVVSEKSFIQKIIDKIKSIIFKNK